MHLIPTSKLSKSSKLSDGYQHHFLSFRHFLFTFSFLFWQIVSLHIIWSKAAFSGELFDGAFFDTALSGEGLKFADESGEIVVVSPGGSRAKVQQKDLGACGGVIHIIDTVLIPQSIQPAKPPPPPPPPLPPEEAPAGSESSAAGEANCTTPHAAILKDGELRTLAKLLEVIPC